MPLLEETVVRFVETEFLMGRKVTLYELEYKMQEWVGVVDGEVVKKLVYGAAYKKLIAMEYSSQMGGIFLTPGEKCYIH